MIGSCSAEPPDAAPKRLRTSVSSVATHGGPCQDASRWTSGRKSASPGARAKVRCGRYGRSSTGSRQRRAAAAAEPASLRSLSRSPCTPVHNTRLPNRPPPPRDNDSGGCRVAARLSRWVSSSTTSSPTSPRKTSVRCHCSGRFHRNSGASSRSAAVVVRSASTTSSGGVSATNNRTAPSWQSHVRGIRRPGIDGWHGGTAR